MGSRIEINTDFATIDILVTRDNKDMLRSASTVL